VGAFIAPDGPADDDPQARVRPAIRTAALAAMAGLKPPALQAYLISAAIAGHMPADDEENAVLIRNLLPCLCNRGGP
jgi:hypothetical protein